MLGTPGLAPLWLASIVGRLPSAALGLALLLRTRELTGSYAAGGVVAAVFGLGVGAGQPLLGRLIDRRGQAAVLVPAGAVAAAAVAAFAALPDGAPTGVAIILAAVAGGAAPPLSSCLRALLAEAVAPALRHRAFALDSTLFELVYITGPLVIVGVVGAWSLRAAVWVCAVLTLAGTIAFASTRLSRDARGAGGTRDLAGPLGDGGVRVLLAGGALFGLSVANLEVGLAAFAGAEGASSAVGYLLALSGAGSLVGGVVAARTPPPADPVRRLVALLAALAVLEAPLAAMPTLATMGAMVAVASLAISPALALAFRLVSEVAPAGTVTEAMTWVSSAINLGAALGAALAGVVVEHVSTAASLALISAFTAVQAGTTAAFRRPLTRSPAPR